MSATTLSPVCPRCFHTVEQPEIERDGGGTFIRCPACKQPFPVPPGVFTCPAAYGAGSRRASRDA